MAAQQLLPADALSRAELRVRHHGRADDVPDGDRRRRAVPRPGHEAMRRSATAGAVFLLAACTSIHVGEPAKLSERDLSEMHAVLKRDFHARGIATMARIEPDSVQTACNLHHDYPPAEVAKPLEEAQLKAIKFPAGELMGDWRRGQKIAESGIGMQWTDKPGSASGGSCYN